MPTVSVVVPVYNEQTYIRQLLERLERLEFNGLTKEILVINDCSTDGTAQILRDFSDRLRVLNHDRNRGKGEALKTGFANCSGEVIVIQDADLEYDPDDLMESVNLVSLSDVKVVYGSRMMGRNPVGHWAYYLGNLLISLLTRLLYRAKVTDVETGHKVFHRDVLDLITLRNADFGFEVEFTTKLLKNHINIIERPISYHPRRFSEGKKIGWRDGLKAVWLIVKYRFTD